MNKFRKVFMHIVFILLAIAISIALSYGTIFTFIKTGIIVIITGGITLLVGIIDIFRKSTIYKIPGIILLYTSLTLAFGMILNSKKLESKKEHADKIVNSIENWVLINDEFPRNINTLDLDIDSNTYTYEVDSLNNKFYLKYLIDGWHLNTYDSETKEWSSSD